MRYGILVFLVVITALCSYGCKMYGNWGGPGHPQQMPSRELVAMLPEYGKAIDQLDAAFRNHDWCYADKGYFNRSCDEQLIQEASLIKDFTYDQFLGSAATQLIFSVPISDLLTSLILDAATNDHNTRFMVGRGIGFEFRWDLNEKDSDKISRLGELFKRETPATIEPKNNNVELEAIRANKEIAASLFRIWSKHAYDSSYKGLYPLLCLAAGLGAPEASLLHSQSSKHLRDDHYSACSVVSPKQNSLYTDTLILDLAERYYTVDRQQAKEVAFELFNATQSLNRHPRALVYLGAMYIMGEGTQANRQKAIPLFIRAAEMGETEAQSIIGYIFYKGPPPYSDYKKALNWLNIAAKKGNAMAQYHLAVMILNGHGIEKDNSLAQRLMYESAKQGYSKAQCHLGRLLYKVDPTKNRQEAFMWLKRAEDQGDIYAKHLLEVYFNNNQPEQTANTNH